MNTDWIPSVGIVLIVVACVIHCLYSIKTEDKEELE